jgi:EmrB/QacA subfamily drug resistance transporter
MAGVSPEAPSPTSRQPVGTLRIVDGEEAGRTIELVSDVVLGRGASADVVLTDSSGEMSRRHARIAIRGTEAVLDDLQSKNGTFINSERLDGPQRLRAGDKIELGAYTLEFIPAVAPTPLRPERDGRAQLKIISGPGAGTSTSMVGSATIGREPECDLQVLESEVSRRHAKVTVQAGATWIDDLNSTNGTYVNGERVLGRYDLASGDKIQIGTATIELTLPAEQRTVIRTRPPQPTRTREVLSHPVILLAPQSGNRKWWTLAVVCVSSFMLLLDVTIVAVARPSISVDLHASFASLQWIVDAYTLTLSIALLTAGSLADIFGRKRVLAIGLVVFTGASVACAQAPNATLLDVFRGVQGIGAALMFSAALALIVQEFPPHERGIAFGVFGLVAGLAVALGPIIGGLLTDGFGWQAIFYINLPIGILGLVVTQRRLVNLPGPPTRIDWPGVVTFSGAMFLAVYATIQGNDLGWTSGVILGSFAGAVVLFAAFLIIEKRRTQPMVDLALFRQRTFVGANIAAFTMSFASITLLFFLTIWFQSILGYSPIGAGLRLVVFTGATLTAAPIAGALSDKVSPRVMLTLGLVLIAGGSFFMSAILKPSSPWTAIILGMLLGGWGTGIINPTMAAASLGVVPPSRAGVASGVNNTAREAGQTAGIAVLGTLLQHTVGVHVRTLLAGTVLSTKAHSLGNAISEGATQQIADKVPVQARAQLLHAAHVSYVSGLRSIFVVSGAVAILGAISSVVLVRGSDLKFPTAGGH